MANDYKAPDWADKVEIKGAEQFEHVSFPIPAEDVFGVHKDDPKLMHLNPMNTAAEELPDYANEEEKGTGKVEKKDLPDKS